jgi:hypothetical protein
MMNKIITVMEELVHTENLSADGKDNCVGEGIYLYPTMCIKEQVSWALLQQIIWHIIHTATNAPSNWNLLWLFWLWSFHLGNLSSKPSYFKPTLPIGGERGVRKYHW